MTLYAVTDADGFVLETWESPFEPQQPRTRQRGDRLVKKTPNATGWVVVDGACRRGDRLAMDEHGCGRLAMEGNAQTYSPLFSRWARSGPRRGCSRTRRTGCGMQPGR